MPLYDFKCRKCGHVFEKQQGMNDPNALCEKVLGEGYAGCVPMGEVKCGGETDKVYTSPPRAHFQGGGWAKDNYASVKPQMTVNQMIDRSTK